MKMSNFNKIRSLLLIFLFSFLIFSCKESDSIDDIPDQLFRPTNFVASVRGNSVSFSWVPMAGASYSLELSRDSFLFTKDLMVVALDGVSYYSVEDLYSTARYSARIKSVSKDKSLKDSEYKSITFITGIENIFYTVTASDIGKNQILVKWPNSKSVSQLVVSKAGAADAIIPLSASDQANGQKLADNLISNTTYIFKIYFGDMLRGTISVKTLP